MNKLMGNFLLYTAPVGAVLFYRKGKVSLRELMGIILIFLLLFIPLGFDMLLSVYVIVAISHFLGFNHLFSSVGEGVNYFLKSAFSYVFVNALLPFAHSSIFIYTYFAKQNECIPVIDIANVSSCGTASNVLMFVGLLWCQYIFFLYRYFKKQ